jgi:hypothetical protein
VLLSLLPPMHQLLLHQLRLSLHQVPLCVEHQHLLLLQGLVVLWAQLLLLLLLLLLEGTDATCCCCCCC